MTWALATKKIDEVFRVRSGDFHATKELDSGDTPLISCGQANNGLVGYFDIPARKTHRDCITVAYNGSWPLLAKFHPYRFGAKDDVAVLIPRTPLRDTTLVYVAAVLNRMTWRYSYGRKCFREKLRNVVISIPITDFGDGGDGQIDEEAIREILPRDFRSLIPERCLIEAVTTSPTEWRCFNILEIFDIERGDFHSISHLDPGNYRTVSRVTEDNGVVGYFDLPDGARVYPRGVITVSTVGADAFVQLGDFIATDNVIICTPKKPLRITTLFFTAFILNEQKWRYSYGRQCYKAKFASTVVPLPVTESGDLDEGYMAAHVENTAYWPQVRAAFDR